MLPRAERLTTRQFERAFADSQTVRHPLVVLRAHPRGDGQNITRAAFVVPKKQAKLATARNRIRRWLRERYRLHSLRNFEALAGCDLIFLATPQTRDASVQELDGALEEVLKRAAKRVGSSSGSRKKVDVRVPPSSGANQGEAEKPEFFKADEESEQPLPSPSPQATPEEARTQYPAAATKSLLPLTFLALWLIRVYQRFISPGLPPSCRFKPSCSRYTYAAIERFGLLRGGFLGAARICKCHPWHAGGDDPVPPFFPVLARKSQNKKPFLMRFRSCKHD